jgi:hypothetical protein
MANKIPKALREQVWLKYIGKKYNSKCIIRWCKNDIDVFNFHVGHNIPESLGGPTVLENLRPICSRCNHSMNNNYYIDEWNNFSSKHKLFHKFCYYYYYCFSPENIPARSLKKSKLPQQEEEKRQSED